jgi:hypothetical protein
MDMARVVGVALAAALGLAPGVAAAQERVGDAALGALSGALVGGPIGAEASGTTALVMSTVPRSATIPLPNRKAARLVDRPSCSGCAGEFGYLIRIALPDGAA